MFLLKRFTSLVFCLLSLSLLVAPLYAAEMLADGEGRGKSGTALQVARYTWYEISLH